VEIGSANCGVWLPRGLRSNHVLWNKFNLEQNRTYDMRAVPSLEPNKKYTKTEQDPWFCFIFFPTVA
jgi:hypothetical protein